MALASWTSGGLSDGKVHSRAMATEFCFVVCDFGIKELAKYLKRKVCDADKIAF
jgi:hypothetical protein